MTNQQQVTALIKSMAGQANILTIPRVFISLLGGDVNAALLLSQIVYWSDRSSRTDGMFYKSYREWEDEIGLSQYEVGRAAKKLQANGLIEVTRKRANKAPTLHYKLYFDVLTNSIIKFLDNQETSQSDYQETSQSDYQVSLQSLTEITTETTTKTTPPQKKSTIHKQMFGQLVDLCHVDAGLKRGQLNKTVKQLVDSGYTPADLAAFGEWWEANDFRGKRGEPPTIGQVGEKIRQAKDAAAADRPAAEKQYEEIWVDGELRLMEVNA